MSKSTSRVQTSQIPVRMEPEEREFLDLATKRIQDDLQKGAPGARFGLAPFLKASGIERAEKVLGMTFEQFKAKKGRAR